jgi:hypothetical protein
VKAEQGLKEERVYKTGQHEEIIDSWRQSSEQKLPKMIQLKFAVLLEISQ